MSAGLPDDEGFLSRWSRRKRELAEPEATRAAASGEVPPPADAGPPAAEAAPVEAASAEPEPVEPPSLDLIDKDFDLAPWLKRNVPESWKLAALRRAWETDPAIRDFENPARDYALDWNTPGGAPGYGPLTESDDVAGILRGIFGEAPEPEAPTAMAEGGKGDGMSHPLSSNAETDQADAAVRQDLADNEASAPVRLSGTADETPDSAAPQQEAGRSVYVAVQNVPREMGASGRLRKRGGGAVPI